MLLFTACANGGIDDGMNSNNQTNGSETQISSPKPSADENKVDHLSMAISSAILTQNAGIFYPGECQGEGHILLESITDGDTLSAYVLAEYHEYGFEDGYFVDISGSRRKVLINLKILEDSSYNLIDYTFVDEYSELNEDEIFHLIKNFSESTQNYIFTEDDIKILRGQADEHAKAYLLSIGRDAIVCPRSSHEITPLTDLGISDEVDMMLSKDDATNVYPYWAGKIERVEDGVRFVYETNYNKQQQAIIFIKTRYDTQEIVETLTFDAVNGEKVD